MKRHLEDKHIKQWKNKNIIVTFEGINVADVIWKNRFENVI